METTFKQLGFYKDYYLNGKFTGSLRCEKDRDIFGYTGRKSETLTEALTLDNKKKIKAGAAVITELFPLCGRATIK